MSDVKNNQEDNTAATGNIQPIEPTTKAAKAPTADTPSASSKTETKEVKIELQAEKPNANNEKRKRIAKDLFAKNDGLAEIFFTSDFMPFAKKQDAKKHGAGLSDKTVIPIIKED